MSLERQRQDLDRWLAESSESLRAILNALPALVAYWDRDLRNRMANDAYVDYFGRRPEEMRGMHIRELLGPKLYELNRPYIERALAGEQQLFDREIPTPSGQLRYTQASYIPDVFEGEVRGFFVLVTDITERRRAEAENERSRARLAEAERVAHIGSWEWDVGSDEIVCSDGLLEIYGIAREEFDSRFQPGESKFVHPDDRARVTAELRHGVEAGTPIDFEYRIIRPDGRVRRIHSRAELISDPEGQALHLTGTVQDVTEVRATAEALHQTAADLGRRAAELTAPSGRRARPEDELAKALTARQFEILALASEGLGNADIANCLFLSESTVKWHVRKILRALGVANRTQAVARFLSARAAE